MIKVSEGELSSTLGIWEKKVIVNSWKSIIRTCTIIVSMGMRRKAIAEA